MSITDRLTGKNVDQAPRSWQRTLLYLVPLLVLFSTMLVFDIAVRILGKKTGYLAGFVFYWLFCCFFISWLTIGLAGIRQSLKRMPSRISRQSMGWASLLLLPLVLGYGYAFPKALPAANMIVIGSSLLLALVNGLFEEILWRASYTRFFQDNVFMAIIYPSVGFGAWHFSPQTIYPAQTPGASVSFVVVATAIGIFYALFARRYHSIYWTAIAHILFDFSGLGGRLYFS